MEIQRLAAFSDSGAGGNPAGVVIVPRALPAEQMARIAAEVGYSETVFASPADEDAPDANTWRARYFSPESEVPFCGHATIALGAALAREYGEGRYALQLHAANITVDGAREEQGFSAKLASPLTHSRPASDAELTDALALLGLNRADLDPVLPPARAHGGAEHLVLALTSRAKLAAMDYDLDQGRQMMRTHGLVTIMLVHVETPTRFHVRNAFASGGVLEDPATGAAAAAFAGYLRDIGWSGLGPQGGELTIVQGEDMGARSVIHVALTNTPGASVEVSGAVRAIEA